MQVIHKTKVKCVGLMLGFLVLALGCCSTQRLNSTSPWISSFRLGAEPVYEHLPEEFKVGLTGLYLRYEATIWSAFGSRTYLSAYYGRRYATADEAIALEQRSLRQNHPRMLCIRVEYWGSSGYVNASRDYWSAQSRQGLLRNVALVADGRRIQPLYVSSSIFDDGAGGGLGGWLQIVFGRQTDGKPVLAPNMKEVYLEIADPNAKVKLPFDVTKMVVNGEVVY
jgi:hypothetical protein